MPGLVGTMMRIAGRGAAASLGLWLLTASGCASTSAQIVTDTRELSESSSAPSLDRIDDAGPGDVLLTSAFAPGPGDGVAAIGELLWLHGSRFGRRPTVLVAGQAVPVLARTDDQGVVVRVPPRVPAGRQEVVVANEHGEARRGLTLVRRGCVLLPAERQIACVDETEQGPLGPSKVLPLTDVAAFVASDDGRALYAIVTSGGGAGHLAVVALAAQGGPRVVGEVPLARKGSTGGRWFAQVATSKGRATLFVAGADMISSFELASPLRPTPVGDVRWPRPLGRPEIRRAAISPDGRWFALADRDDSTVIFWEIGDDKLRESASVDLLPAFHANGVADLQFARDGQSLFVLTGETVDGARVANSERPRVFRLAPSANRGWSVTQETHLPGIRWPSALRESRVRALESGASIRRPTAILPWYVAGQATDDDRRSRVLKVQGDVVRAVGDVPGIVLGLADAPDARWLLAACASGGGDKPAQVTGPVELRALVVDDRPGNAAPVSISASTAPFAAAASTRGVALEVQP